MLKPKQQPTHPPLQAAAQPLPSRFNLLVWNLQKTATEQLSPEKLQQLIPVLSHTPIHLYALQEAVIQHPEHSYLNLPYAMSCNMQGKTQHYGVITASNYQMQCIEQFLTQRRELGLLTHKSALLTAHFLPDQTPLYLLNLHAMIFVPYVFFKKELQRLLSLISDLENPLIVAGDFNTWSQKRSQLLDDCLEQYQLQKAPIETPQHIKSIHHHPLDHIYYRGLNLIQAQALNVPQCSDHNPLIAQFVYPL
ncbi:endonuclease/exonuclease/phosphatase family protein [Galenea microaerophila]